MYCNALYRVVLYYITLHVLYWFILTLVSEVVSSEILAVTEL